MEVVHSPEFSMDYQVDRYHEIFFLLRGIVRIHLHGYPDPYELVPNEWILIPAGTSHRLEDISPATLFLLCISPERINENDDRRALWCQLVDPVQPVRPGNSTTRHLAPHWRGLLAPQPAEPNSRFNLELWSHTDAILLLLEQSTWSVRSTTTSWERVTEFRKHLQSKYYERWTVDRAARYCGLSVRRFSGLYSEIHERTFIRDLQSIRISVFCDLVSSGSFSIPGAAFSAGFEDLSHFYRVFHKEKGMPPGRWLSH